MGCPDEAILDGESLVFSVCVHNPETSGLVDADSLPSYRVYENLTETPILTGQMAKLDDPSTTGFYVGSFDPSTANGFEADTNYTIYITAVVNGVEGGISYNLKVNSPEPTSISLSGTTIFVEDT